MHKDSEISKWTHDGFSNDPVDTEIAKAKERKDKSRETTAQAQPKYSPSTAQVNKVIGTLGTDTLRANELMSACGFKSMRYFRANFLRKALDDGALWLEFPDAPNSPNQRYRLSDKALTYYLSLSKDSTEPN